jgi:hypothetical protein
MLTPAFVILNAVKDLLLSLPLFFWFVIPEGNLLLLLKS